MVDLSVSMRGNNGSEDIRSRLVELLNQQLVDTVDLRSQARQARLNVRGPYTNELGMLFDGLVRDLHESIDAIAGRISALGGYAATTARIVAHQSHLREYPRDAFAASEHLQALLSSYSKYEWETRNTMKAVQTLGDFTTALLVEKISASIERNLWLLEAHLEGIAVGLHGEKFPR
jgi:starvation-inducible DNA-binding protein